MGTIVVEEYYNAGINSLPELPVTALDNLVVRTADATTSTSDESIALGSTTNLLRVYTEQVHRLRIGAATGTLYMTTEAGKWHDIGVVPSSTLYYRTDV